VVCAVLCPLLLSFTAVVPCRCKILGPTFGLVVGVVAAVICWPFGALVYCCNRTLGDRAFSVPVNTYGSVKNSIPI
jgi:hypothetical protein